MSPFCPGRTLASCPSPQAAELVQWIVMQEAAGATREEVIEILVERYGEEILGAPPAEGITLWAYVFPVLGFVLFGGVSFSRCVGSWRHRARGARDPGPAPHRRTADTAAEPRRPRRPTTSSHASSMPSSASRR